MKKLLDQALAQLKKLGSDKMRAHNRKHGAGNNQFGVRLGDGLRGELRESLITGIESLGSQVISGFPVTYSATSHAASKFVEMSMLTGDGRVRT